MSLGEWLVIFLVALIVFGPKQLPMLADHLGRIARTITNLREKSHKAWDAGMKELQLLENEEKAAKADTLYQSDKD